MTDNTALSPRRGAPAVHPGYAALLARRHSLRLRRKVLSRGPRPNRLQPSLDAIQPDMRWPLVLDNAGLEVLRESTIELEQRTRLAAGHEPDAPERMLSWIVDNAERARAVMAEAGHPVVGWPSRVVLRVLTAALAWRDARGVAVPSPHTHGGDDGAQALRRAMGAARWMALYHRAATVPHPLDVEEVLETALPEGWAEGPGDGRHDIASGRFVFVVERARGQVLDSIRIDVRDRAADIRLDRRVLDGDPIGSLVLDLGELCLFMADEHGLRFGD